MRNIILAVFGLSILLLGARPSLACNGSYLTANSFQPDADTSIQFVTPTSSTVLKDDFLQIFVTYSESRVGALTPLDHIHYGIALAGTGKAAQGEFTMPDTTGRVEIYLDNPEENGIYEVCAYLARADHTHLSETACTTFVLATSGMKLFEPRGNKEYSVSTLAFEFETYGSDVDYLEYSIDGGDKQRLDKSTTEIELPPLDNGTHTIVVQAFDIDDNQLGKTITREFTISSPLTFANLKKLRRFIKRAKKNSRSSTGDGFLKKAKRLAKKMKNGGSYSSENSNLNESSMRRAHKLLRQSIKSKSTGPLRQTLKLLKNILG